MALGFGELIEGATESIPSLVIAVGEVFTDYTPGDVVAFSIANIGASQKTVLTVGIVVVSLLVCAWLGRMAARGHSRIALGGFALFGLIGGWAAARNPLSPAVASWIVALVAAALGAVTTMLLLRLAVVAPSGPVAEGTRAGTRRSFFGYAAGAAVTALGLVGVGRGLRGESVAEQARETYALPSRDPAPAQDSPQSAAPDVSPDASAGGVAAPDPQFDPDPVGDGPTAAADPLNEQPADTAGAAAADGGTGPSEPNTFAAPDGPEPSEVTAAVDSTTTQPAPTTTTTTPPAAETSSNPAPTTTAAQPAPTTTATQPAPTTTASRRPPTTTTEPPPTTTTTEPPPTTTTTEPPPTTTQPPRNLSVSQQVARLDTLDDVAGISSYITPITPTNEFYRIDTALTVPQIDPDNWRLRITGLVDNPYELTFGDILAMDLSDHVITLSCVSNTVGGRLVGNAIWTGVPLAALLDRAGVHGRANQVVGRSVDDFTAGFPTELTRDGRNAILAIGMNDELLPTRHGFPARLVVAGLYGYVSAVKWLDEIHLTTWDAFDGYWVPRGWSKRGPIKTQSRIDVPRNDASLRAGEPTWIAGIAWAPTRGIRRVEVRVDNEDWVECRLGQPLGNESWVQWQRSWTPTSGRHRIQVRATDGRGTTQGSASVPARPNGAEGWHTISVRA